MAGGVWLLHDHQERGVTNNGLGPGGNLGAIVYREFLGNDGWPQTSGEDLSRYFQADYYQRLVPEPDVMESMTAELFLQLVALGIAIGAFAAGLVAVYRALFGRNRAVDEHRPAGGGSL